MPAPPSELDPLPATTRNPNLSVCGFNSPTYGSKLSWTCPSQAPSAASTETFKGI